MSIELQVGVKIVLQNQEGKYLLLRRSPEKYKGVVGTWDIVGGRIDPGASLLENLKREIKEETGLVFSEEPRLIAAQDILRVPGRHVVRLTYIGGIDGEPKLGDEHIEFQWCTRGTLFHLDDLDIYFRELLDRGVLL